MAGAVGVEPTLAVLETAILPLKYAPGTKIFNPQSPISKQKIGQRFIENCKLKIEKLQRVYFLDSLWTVCFLHHLQYRLYSSFRSTVFLFL